MAAWWTDRDLGDDHLIRRQAERADRYRNRLIHQLERLGHKVILEPIPEGRSRGLHDRFCPSSGARRTIALATEEASELARVAPPYRRDAGLAG
jgi:hypothetical protein